MTTTTQAAQAKRAGGARRAFYAVEFLFADGHREISRSFATKVAATKWAHHFSRLAETRVLLGGAGGVEVMSLDQVSR